MADRARVHGFMDPSKPSMRLATLLEKLERPGIVREYPRDEVPPRDWTPSFPLHRIYGRELMTTSL